MKKELDEALVRDFPNLYADRFADMRQTAMCWGFDCGDGWEPIIRRLSEKLEAMINALPEPKTVPAGTCKFGDYPAHTPQKPRASQVKEKWGTLSFYLNYGTQEMYDEIDEASYESSVTCEECGEPGVCRDGSYVRTLCDVCNEEWEKRNGR